MKKALSLLIMLIIIPLSLSAQKTKDALYLKNGSIIYGKLMEISGDNYRIMTSDGSQFNFKSEEVDKFIKENPPATGRKIKGPGFSVEAGLLAGAQNSEYDAPFSFNILIDYTYSTKNVLSAGSGIEYLGTGFSPLFFQYKHIFNDNKVAPFIFFKAGRLIHMGGDDNTTDANGYTQYNYPIDYKGGGLFAIGTGVSVVHDESEIYMSFAYRYAQTSYKENAYNNVTYTYKNNFNRLEVKVGFKF